MNKNTKTINRITFNFMHPIEWIVVTLNNIYREKQFLNQWLL